MYTPKPYFDPSNDIAEKRQVPFILHILKCVLNDRRPDLSLLKFPRSNNSMALVSVQLLLICSLFSITFRNTLARSCSLHRNGGTGESYRLWSQQASRFGEDPCVFAILASFAIWHLLLSIASTGKASIASQKCWLSIREIVRNKYSRFNVGKNTLFLLSRAFRILIVLKI